MREDSVHLSASLDITEEFPGLTISFFVTNASGSRVLDESLVDNGEVKLTAGHYEVTLDVPPILNVGKYTVGIWIGTALEDLLTSLLPPVSLVWEQPWRPESGCRTGLTV